MLSRQVTCFEEDAEDAYGFTGAVLDTDVDRLFSG